MSFADTLLLSFLAALLSLDQTACFQVLLSRPMVTALILGAVFGDLTGAVLIGICFEFLFGRAIPVKERAAADPTLATAAVLAGVWGLAGTPPAATPPIHPWSAVPFAAAFGLLAAFLSKWFDLRLRDVNVELSHRLHRVGAIQLTAVGVLFAKSFGFYLLTVLAMQSALPKFMVVLGSSAPTASVLAWFVLLSVCVAYATAPLVHSSGRTTWIIGLIIGTSILALTRLFQWPFYTVILGIAAALIIAIGLEFVRHWRKKPPAAEEESGAPKDHRQPQRSAS